MIKDLVGLVKKLRMQTGAGILECKKALLKSGGDIELSIDYLRSYGFQKAQKKISNRTLHGSIFLDIKDKIGVILELNSETDFVSRSIEFKNAGRSLLNKCFLKKIKSISDLKDMFEKQRIQLISKFSENISIRRFKVLCGNSLGVYLHSDRIGVLLSSSTFNADKKTLNQIAMHITANRSEYFFMNEIPKSVIDREYDIQLNLAKKERKEEFVIQKIIKGRMKNFFDNICCSRQKFLLNDKKSVKDILKEKNILINDFVRFELGE